MILKCILAVIKCWGCVCGGFSVLSRHNLCSFIGLYGGFSSGSFLFAVGEE
jgi:hypothetical protein